MQIGQGSDTKMCEIGDLNKQFRVQDLRLGIFFIKFLAKIHAAIGKMENQNDPKSKKQTEGSDPF